MRAFEQEVIVDVAEQAAKPVRVLELPFSLRIAGSQAIGGARVRTLDQSLEEVVLPPRQAGQHFALGVDDVQRFGMGNEGPDHQTVVGLMRTENPERVAVARGNNSSHVSVMGTPCGFGHSSLPGCLVLLCRSCGDVPDVPCIFADRAVRREPPDPRRVEDTGPPPSRCVLPMRIHVALRGIIGIEVGRDQEVSWFESISTNPR